MFSFESPVATHLYGESGPRPVTIFPRNRDADGFTLIAGHTTGAPFADFVLSPAFTDWHVHTSLFETKDLVGSPVARVLDLGSDPERVRSAGEVLKKRHGFEVLSAGVFITPRGGYPSDRSWKEPGSVIECDRVEDAFPWIEEQSKHGAGVIKIAQNSTAGPVFNLQELSEIVAFAKQNGLRAVVHTEGPGEAEKARLAGCAVLAHTPFTERLADSEIAAQAKSLAWISTLDIHGYGNYEETYDTAFSNLKRFVAAGGRVLYGTDMGNGPTPVELNEREVAALKNAGLQGEGLLKTLLGKTPAAGTVAIPGGVNELNISGSKLVQLS